MADSSSSDSIVEEREKLGFIKPSKGLSSIDKTLAARQPRHCLSSKKWPLELKFHGWRDPPKKWKVWVEKMASLHESTWKKAGVFEAIMNSMYEIKRNNDLVFEVADKWCPNSNTFIFPWGEATITLEDVMMLEGYSVLGSTIFTPLDTEEMKKAMEELNNGRKEAHKTTSKKVYCCLWMRIFMNSDSTVEHEAFLALWLSRFVFPSCFEVVVERVFPIAIHLARGTRIALAPAILANIYRDLSKLKKKMDASTKLVSNYKGKDVVTLWSPLALVQVWVWERFRDLRPTPNVTENGKPRLALWHRKIFKVHDVRSVLDSAKERFDWQPYVKIKAKCGGAKTDSSLDDRCLKASELVGFDCKEQYRPQRVALQFGMDEASMLEDQICFNRKRSRTNEMKGSDVFKRLKMLRRRLIEDENKTETTSDSFLSKPSRELPLNVVNEKEPNNSPFPPKCNTVVEAKSSVNKSEVATLATPGSYPNQNRLEVINEEEVTAVNISIYSSKHGGVENIQSRNDGKSASNPYSRQLTLTEMLKSYHKHINVASNDVGEGKNKTSGYCHSSSPKFADKLPRCREQPTTLVEDVPTEATNGGSRKATIDVASDNAGRSGGNRGSTDDKAACISDNEGHGNTDDTDDNSSFLIADVVPRCRELPTTLVEDVVPTEAATNKGSRKATIDVASDNGGRSVGNHGSTDDKAAACINDVEGYGNGYRIEMPRLDLEARISRVERLVAELKEGRKLKS